MYTSLLFPGVVVEWPTVEHYYQAQKFSPDARLETDVLQREKLELMDSIRQAASPEEASDIGRSFQKSRTELVSKSWYGLICLQPLCVRVWFF